ncbi:GtrA family protein [Microbacterium aurum]
MRRERRFALSPRSIRVLHQFGRFLVVGLLSFAVDYGVYLLLLTWLQYIVASSISFATSLVVNYVLTLRFVFIAHPGRSVAKEFASFVGLNVVALGLNQLILFLAVSYGGTSEPAGKVIATAVVLVYNFISRKLLIERAASSATLRRAQDSAENGTSESGPSDALAVKPIAP